MVKDMDYGLPGMRMDRRKKKELSRMGNKMGNILGGMIMDRGKRKKLTRMVKEMD